MFINEEDSSPDGFVSKAHSSHEALGRTAAILLPGVVRLPEKSAVPPAAGIFVLQVREQCRKDVFGRLVRLDSAVPSRRFVSDEGVGEQPSL